MPFLNRTDELWNALEGVVEEAGLGIYDVERLGASSLRVVIERRAQAASVAEDGARQGGVTSGDCSMMCRRLMTYFSVEGPRFGLGTEPEIEVSSPGVNRNLRLERHFESALGERVKLVLRDEEERDASAVKRKAKGGALFGKLTAATTAQLRILEETSGNEITIDRSRLKSARVDYKF